MPEDCPCGSGLPAAQCCYARFPSIALNDGSPGPNPADFYARWAICRNMLWRRIVEHFPQRTPGRQGSLVVLGAGPCRDLPVDYLCSAFDDIVFVDKNDEALANSALYVPAGLDHKVTRVCWDVTGEFGQEMDLLLQSVRTKGQTLEEAADAAEALPDGWRKASLPDGLASRLPFDLVISDLVMTQISLNYAFQLSLALATPLRELFSAQRSKLLRLSRVAGRNHLDLLRLLAGPGSGILVLNDTFMLGRDYDGSASLFNLVAEARGKDAADSSWIGADDIDAWLPDYSLLGSDLAGLIDAGATVTAAAPAPALKLSGRTWWWWPHCAVKSYLVLCYVLRVA